MGGGVLGADGATLGVDCAVFGGDGAVLEVDGAVLGVDVQGGHLVVKRITWCPCRWR